MAESRRLWEASLNAFRRGLLFHYFGTTDRNQHMFWRLTNLRSPRYDPKLAKDYRSVVEDCYRLGDELAGEALEACDKDTSVVLFSDHGFAPFDRQFDLNTWLAEHGYFTLRRPGARGNIAQEADWRQTLAYGIGLNAIYINVKGRERDGIVEPSRRQSVARRLARDLCEVHDPKTGRAVVDNVYLADDVYASTLPGVTPDLVVGYARGYRCSVESSRGLVGSSILDDNVSKWSGDHCIDRSAVPGIVLASKPIQAESVGLADLTVTALREFGVEPTDGMIGRAIW